VDEIKRCGRCKESKPVEDFNENKARYDGRGSYCKACKRMYEFSQNRRAARSMNPHLTRKYIEYVMSLVRPKHY